MNSSHVIPTKATGNINLLTLIVALYYVVKLYFSGSSHKYCHVKSEANTHPLYISH